MPSEQATRCDETKPHLLRRLGPGLITGAADDDPSGIATYSQAGAQFGFSLLWTMLFSYPLMAAIQEICARLGRITGAGIAANLRKAYPGYVTGLVVGLLCLANLFNLGADISAMGAAAHLVSGVSAAASGAVFGALSLVLQILIPYRKYVAYLRWLTWSLLAYVATAFMVRIPWPSALRSAVLPALSFDRNYLMALVGLLGTTISPYLFFWQSSQEAEEIRVRQSEEPLKKKAWQAKRQFQRIALDTRVGMAFSNLVAFFIVLTTAATLHTYGAKSAIISAADAASALRPLAGNQALWLFALGIVGTGLLAVPVLAGSAAYAVADFFQWPGSLEEPARRARKFYAILGAATLGGVGLNFLGIDPMHALFASAVINGIVAVPLMFLIMLISGNSRIVGQFRLPLHLRVGGWAATIAMLLATLSFAIFSFSR